MKMPLKTAGTAALLLLTTALPALAASAEPIIAKPIFALSEFQEVGAKHALPTAITVAGQSLQLDQQALLQGETLLVPLRFIAEAAKGEVAWDGATQTITVTMPDRTAIFVIGQAEAELNQRGVFYIQRNMIKLAQPVQIIGGRTMISADALTTILGLVERTDGDTNLDLMTRPAPADDSAHIQISPTALDVEAAPAELKAWGADRALEETSAYTVVTAADGTRYLAISGGLQRSGGYSIEILSTKLVNGTWVIEAQVVPPTGPATMALTNPVAYFQLSGMDGNIQVNVIGGGAPADKR